MMTLPRRLGRWLSLALGLTLFASAAPPPSWALPETPIGAPATVSANDGGDYSSPAAAAGAGGQAAIVWHGRAAGSADEDIYLQRYAPSGSPTGAPLRVNTSLAGSQRRAALAFEADGGLVVVWDTNASAVRGRRFAPSGAPRGDEFAISPAEVSARDAAVAARPGGGFVVAWEQLEPDDSLRVAAAAFGADGSPLGAAPLPAPAAGRSQANPALAFDPGGHLAIVWELQDEFATGLAIELQRIDPLAAPVALAEVAQASGPGEVRDPALAFAANGDLLVAWAALASDMAPEATIMLRRYGPEAGQPLGPAAPASPSSPAERAGPALAAAADGSFALAWADQTSAEGGQRIGILAQRYAADGSPEGGPLYPGLPGTPPASGFSPPALAAANELLLVAWSSQGDAELGQQATRSVAARRYGPPRSEVLLPLIAR